jgi:hypothetical protein
MLLEISQMRPALGVGELIERQQYLPGLFYFSLAQ